MFKLCRTNSSWLQGLWKKALSHVSFQMRLCACLSFSLSSRSTTVTPGSFLNLAAVCNGAKVRIFILSFLPNLWKQSRTVHDSSRGFFAVFHSAISLQRSRHVLSLNPTHCDKPLPNRDGSLLCFTLVCVVLDKVVVCYGISADRWESKTSTSGRAAWPSTNR